MDLWQLLGSLHPKLIHFPLVLLLSGLIFDAVGLLSKSERCHWAGRVLSCAGVVSLLMAFVCGIYAEVWAGRAGIPEDQIELHELFANLGSWGFVVLTAWRLFLEGRYRKQMTIYLLLGFAWYGFMIITAHLGGALILNYGAAVTGARSNSPLSLHDLNTLATRQTDLNLWFSELMHHIFGGIVGVLALSLLISAIWPKTADKLKWVAPLLLAIGGVFLFFCADLDLYRFTDPRQWIDREVQLHKALAIILITVGIAGLKPRKRASSTTGLRSADNLPPSPGTPGEGEGEGHPVPASHGQSQEIPLTLTLSPRTERGDKIAANADDAAGFRADTSGHLQSKLIAVMALIGGSLLFTHVHTVAPYANVAAGVYIAHIVLGTTALLIGAARLAADAWPRRQRAFMIAFALLLCCESFLLSTYNEGLPWYIGYGHYTRTGPHGGTIAPYGKYRAELTFDNDTNKLDIYILDRFDNNKPIPVAASQLNVLLDRAYQETAIPCDAVDGELMKDQPAQHNGKSARDNASAPNANAANTLYIPHALDIANMLPPSPGTPGEGRDEGSSSSPLRATDTADITTLHSHFSATVPILHDVPAFCARLAVPDPFSEDHAPIMGYFDPWVTPVIHFIPPNEVARYHCPMHEGIMSQTPGVCPLCGMPLVPITRFVRTTLHDPQYSMAFSAAADPNDNAQRRLIFTPQKDGALLRDLAVVHTKLLHLIIVSQDLSFFDHVHPLIQPDGSLILDYRFPYAGTFYCFADITPAGDRNQVFRCPVTVAQGGPVAAAPIDPPLEPSAALAKQLTDQDPDITAELIPTPRYFITGMHTQLLVRLSKNNQPIVDLQPYLGAMGHCVIISEDGQTYLHCHPEQLWTPKPNARGGPDVVFHTEFPKPGRYKLWAQFNHGGKKPLVVNFVFDVQSSIIPPNWWSLVLDD